MTTAISNAARPWTADEEEQFRSLALQDKGPALIAKQLGRTDEAIRSHAQKLGISLKRSRHQN